MFDCRKERRFGFREHWVEWGGLDSAEQDNQTRGESSRQEDPGRLVVSDSKEQNVQDRLGGFSKNR